MRTLPFAELQGRWNETRQHAASFVALQRAVKVDGPKGPCEVGCRSVCWKALLLFRTDYGLGWSHILAEYRNTYASLSDHFLKFIKHPEKLNSAKVDPLADDPNSPWNSVRQDELIRQEILQDVRRLPDEPFYHRDSIQDLILNILFIFCKLNPDTGYRQGMHELLAPLVYVVCHDALDMATARVADSAVDSTMMDILDSSFVEHDSFSLFIKLMDNCKRYYEVESPLSPVPSLSGSPAQISAIVEKSRHIHEKCLFQIDPELADHLKRIEILPQIFLIRWVRLLFGREFPFQQHLILWDALFAIDPTLELVDFICVAMLLRIRWQLLESNYSVALQMLLKYPSPEEPYGPHTFVEDASYLSMHLSPLAGSIIVKKYSGKPPAKYAAATLPMLRDGILSSAPRPGSNILEPARIPGLRTPIRNPAQLLGQKDDVRALLTGAAKNVIQQGEKLGINQALKDAVGDIKRGWSDATNQTSMPRTSFAASNAMMALERRNRQLAFMLDEAFNDIKGLSDDEKGSKETIEMAAAKVHFVKVHLEDSTLILTDEHSPGYRDASDSTKYTLSVSTAKKAVLPLSTAPETPPSSPPNQASEAKLDEVVGGFSTRDIGNASEATNKQTTSPICTAQVSEPQNTASSPSEESRASRPSALPTRSTLAQSSFSFMLDSPSNTIDDTTTAQSFTVSPPTKLHRRGTSVSALVSREKNSFLFGDASGSEENNAILESNDIFGLTPIREVGARDMTAKKSLF